MRRGLMSWSRTELPEDALDTRVARLQAAMREHRLQVVLAYTSFARPAVVHWLTNFTPYWSEAVLAVPSEGPPVLLAALTPRVHPWIRSVSRLGEVVAAPRLGEGVVHWLQAHATADARIGVVGLDDLPWAVGGALLQAHGAAQVVDVSSLYRDLRQPADEPEANLARRAAAIAGDALRAAPTGAGDSTALAAAIESSARLAGAEEVTLRVAPDLARGGARLRLENAIALQAHHAVELSVAYKGVWVRLGRSRGDAHGEPANWRAARDWFDGVLPTLEHGVAPPPAALGELRAWTLEASVDSHPLSAVAGHQHTTPTRLPPGALGVLSAELRLADGSHWFHAAPVRFGAHGAVRIDTA